jgi:hypothetical protein
MSNATQTRKRKQTSVASATKPEVPSALFTAWCRSPSVLPNVISWLGTPDLIRFTSRLSLSWQALLTEIPLYMWRSVAKNTALTIRAPSTWAHKAHCSDPRYSLSTLLPAFISRPWIRVYTQLHLPNKTGEAFLPYIQHFDKVEKLYLDGCDELSGNALQSLVGAPLTTLKISSSSFFGCAYLLHLKQVPLISLDISNCRNYVNDDGLVHLKTLPFLRRLIIEGCSSISSNGLLHVAGLRLQELSLAFCCRINNIGLSHLTNMPLLKLDLQGCRINSEGLAHLATLRLRELNLADCFAVGDDGLLHLKNLPLTHLRLQRCDITSNGLRHLTELPLIMLDVGACVSIYDDGLAHLACIRTLQELTLAGCKNITNRGLRHLRRLPLSTLHIESMKGIHSFGKRYITKEMPSCLVHTRFY